MWEDEGKHGQADGGQSQEHRQPGRYGDGDWLYLNVAKGGHQVQDFSALLLTAIQPGECRVVDVTHLMTEDSVW